MEREQQVGNLCTSHPRFSSSFLCLGICVLAAMYPFCSSKESLSFSHGGSLIWVMHEWDPIDSLGDNLYSAHSHNLLSAFNLSPLGTGAQGQARQAGSWQWSLLFVLIPHLLHQGVPKRMFVAPS